MLCRISGCSNVYVIDRWPTTARIVYGVNLGFRMQQMASQIQALAFTDRSCLKRCVVSGLVRNDSCHPVTVMICTVLVSANQ